MKRIPLVDLALQHEIMRDELLGTIEQCYDANQFVGGDEVDLFAIEFAEFASGGYVATCGNGTDALFLSLIETLGLGDHSEEVITTSLTFAATAEAIVLAGYRPVFIDIDPGTCLMDLSAVQTSITPATRAIVPVHLYGQMLDMERLSKIAKHYGLAVVEDAAQAHGALWKTIPPGALSDAACYSFFPGKNLGALGDGGAIHTWDLDRVRNLRRRSDHGRISKYQHDHIGMNSRLDTIQAAVLRVKLRHLKSWNTARQNAAITYNELFHEDEHITPLEKHPHAHHVYHLYVVKVDNRDSVLEILQNNGIGAGIHYPIALHQQSAFSSYVSEVPSCPMAEEVADKIISLPMYPGITPHQIEYVVKTLKKAVRES